jgi:hypothetical protein
MSLLNKCCFHSAFRCLPSRQIHQSRKFSTAEDVPRACSMIMLCAGRLGVLATHSNQATKYIQR